VIAATTLHRLRQRFTSDQILAAATFYNVAVLLVLAFVRSPFLIIASLVLSGAAWTSTMSTINVSVQLAVPAWVQARALGTYMTTFQGGMALGAVLWGAIAERTSTPIALASAAGGLLLTYPFVRRFRILHGPLPDHTPHQFKNPAPQLALDTEPTDGPVRISVEYRVPVENYAEFTHAIHKLRGVRLRDGAIRWGSSARASGLRPPTRLFVPAFAPFIGMTIHLRPRIRFTPGRLPTPLRLPRRGSRSRATIFDRLTLERGGCLDLHFDSTWPVASGTAFPIYLQALALFWGHRRLTCRRRLISSLLYNNLENWGGEQNHGHPSAFRKDYGPLKIKLFEAN
jgi:hypothetical protein